MVEQPCQFQSSSGDAGGDGAGIGGRGWPDAMILVDSNVFMYSSGAAHPNKLPAVNFLERVAVGEKHPNGFTHSDRANETGSLFR